MFQDNRHRKYSSDESGLILPGRPQVIQQALFFGGSGGSGPEVAATWSTVDYVGGITWTNGDKTATNGSLPFGGVRGTLAKSSGKRYLEYYVDILGSGGVECGLGLLATTLGAQASGGANATIIEGGGNLYYNSSNVPGGFPGLTAGDVIQIAMDFSTGNVWFGVNNSWASTSNATADPNTDTSPSFTIAAFIGATLYPIITFGWFNLSRTIRTASADFTYSIPTGFVSWGST